MPNNESSESIKNTIMGEIVKNDKIKLDDFEEISAEQANSEIKAINAIAKIAELTDEQKELLLKDVYTKENILKELSEPIKLKICENKYGNVIDILSHIHDEWIKSNSEEFSDSEDKYKFVDLKLLPYSEVQSDLKSLKPILESCGIEIDDKELEEEFSKAQAKYIKDKELFSHEELVKKLMTGAELKGFGNIEDKIKNKEDAENIARQIEEQICHQKTDVHSHINAVLSGKTLSNLARDLLGEEIDPSTLEITETVDVFNEMLEINSRREKIVDKLIEKGYKKEFFEAIAKEYAKYGVKYAEITADYNTLISKKREKDKQKQKELEEKEIKELIKIIDSIEEETGVKLRFLLGSSRSQMSIEKFKNSELELIKKNPYIIGYDIMRV